MYASNSNAKILLKTRQYAMTFDVVAEDVKIGLPLMFEDAVSQHVNSIAVKHSLSLLSMKNAKRLSARSLAPESLAVTMASL